MKKHLFHAVCLFFLTIMMFVTPVFAEGLSDLKQAAKAYQNTVVEKHQSKRSLDKVKKDLDFELKKHYPNRQRVRDLRLEYIANGARNSNSWLMLMNDMARYRSHWQNNKYYFSSYLPRARSFWEPKENLMILAGVNALVLSKNTKDEENAYREIMALLKTINDHTQAGKGGYKLFALEYEIAEDVLKKTDLPLSKEAKERIAAVEVLLTQKTLKHELKKNSENPQLCFHMRLPLKQRGVKYEDYLRITPQTKVTAVPMKNKQLCVRGFDYAVDYEVELLKAVPTSLHIGHAMTESYKRRVNFGDRKPFVRLSKGKYILSRETMDGLPVETVNVDKVQIKIVKALTERALPHNAHALDSNMRSYNFSSYFHTKGEPIWTGEMDVANMQNKNVTTYFPIDKVMDKPAPGVYAIEAEVKKDKKRLSIAHQYFVVTDIGMTALTADNGLYIFARSLKTAQPLAGVSLSLLSRNNTVLGTGITDKKGVFRFPAALTKGEAGLAPMLVNARGKNDYALIRLNTAAYDLSDRGVAGRAYPGPIDTFVYMDRGVYRPGESANIVALARDQQGKALPDVPLTIKVKRPDWVDFTEKTYSKTQLGGVHLGIDIPKNGRMGSWTVQVYSDPTSAPIGTTTFRVEEYVPPQIEAKLTTKHETLKTDTDYLYNLQGDYLYGAPAAGLKTTSEIVVFKDDQPFEKYKDYTFGLVQDTFTPRRFTVTPVRTDEGGAAQITTNVAGDVLADISVPLTARLRTSIFEKGGRPVSTTLDRPLRHKQVYIGIKERDSQASGQKQNKVFEMIALDQNGNRIAVDGLEYKMVKEEYFYNWYNAHYGWRYERQYFDTPLDKNIVSIPKDKPLVITTASSVDYWWRHRIEVVDHKSGAATSLYASGYWGTSDEDTPDTVDVSAIDRSIAVGKKAEVLIKPPYGGEATIVVAHNEVLDVQQTYIPASGKKIMLDVKENWGAGVYVLVSVIRPGTEMKKQRGGMRGIGLTWLSVDRETSKLKVSFDVPDNVLPRQTFSLPVKVDGLAKGEKSFVTVAAIDEGVLQLTGFKNPDPFAFYFGQRRLGIMMRDIYGKLLKGADGLVGKIRSGGGAMRSDSQAGDAFDPDNYIKTVALFSGMVTPDKNGNVSVPLELPDFNGRLRLMAVAYSKGKIGQGAGDLVVRDPVIVDGSLPRFLAPEDKTQLTLRVQNLDGEAGVYKVAMTTTGAVTQDGVATYDLTLAKGAEETLYLPIKTKPMTGAARVAVNVSGPKGFALTKDWAFDVRPYQILHTEDLLNKIAPSKTYALSKDITDKYWPGTVSASALLSARKDLNVKSLVDSLRRYPYGCTEQLVSSSSPLFHLNKLKKDWKLNIADDEDLIKIRVQNSIRRVANNMRGNGSFGYWRAQDETNVWLSAYATEYLLRGKQAGYDVPTEGLKKALSNLKRHVANPGTHPEQLAAASYAFYVLAKAGEIEVGKLRYFYDLNADKIEVNWALAMLGSGLHHFGEKTRAKEAFEKALNAVENDKPYHYWYYGSKLRNKAVLLAMLAENQSLSLRGDQLLDELVTAYEKQKYFSTQEQVWLTRAAVNMDPKKAGDIKFMIAPNFETIQTDKPYTVDVAKEGEDFSDLKVENMGDEPIYLRLSVLGAPKAALPAEEKGFKITRSYFTLDGEPALVEDKVKQNTLLVAVVEGYIGKYQNRSNENLIVDMLPAGFELENAALSGGKSSSELGWIMKDKEKTKPSYEALKDDRYVASFRHKQKFKLVYLVRAVTPGVYAHPAVYIEDMYHPGIYGRGVSGTVTIVEDKE